ncbi:hypothetical protein [Nocardia farcinica]|uniref:hypothetical protein n=1 Tax=Nocardia farcinica TaxID=37329 RepID=UPI0024568316|nr:hypothetical protein [Nocardia farcinica]
MNRKILAACAAVAAAAVTLTAAAGCGRNDGGGAGLPGLPATAATPLKQTQWFADNFGTPLLASFDVDPKTIEQATDLRGIVLPQNKATLDGPVMWQRVRCGVLPFSTTDGPTQQRADTVYGGYSRTPLGAALAAYHLGSWKDTATTADALPMVLAPSDRERLGSQIVAYKPSDRLDDPSCVARMKNIFRFTRWKADQLSDTVMRVQLWGPIDTPGQGIAIDTTVVWSGGDWYLTEQTAATTRLTSTQKPDVPPFTAEPVGWSKW